MKQENINTKKIIKVNINTYLVESNNDANMFVHFNKSDYCVKCGKKLDENSLDRFCDDDCRRDYFTEIRRDCDGIYNNVF